MDDCMLDDLDAPLYVELMDHQKEAVECLGNGKILYGGVGGGKSVAALAYYMENEKPRDIYIITTAKKRDSLEWDGECARFGLGRAYHTTVAGLVTIDSWNNLKKYEDVEKAFFIFDEQKVIGHGSWVRSFLKIARRNRWILLSATPGDTWLDYGPVFIANGWYKNITDFKRQHVVYRPYVKYPIVAGYLGEAKLERLRDEILVEMPYTRRTTRYINFLDVGYDKGLVRDVVRRRWNVYENRPIKDAAEMFRILRKVVYSDPSRLEVVRFLHKFHDRLIIFYNFDYELEILRQLSDEVVLGEWNGHKKQPIPGSDRWIYLVQYMAGGEGWNCTETDAMVLYSLTYSYKNYLQSQGRIDRLDTPYDELYYYVLISGAAIDRGVKRSLDNKRSFNERENYRNIENFGE